MILLSIISQIIDLLFLHKDAGVSTRRKLLFNEQALLSAVEPKNSAEASKYDDWIKAMNEELDQIEKNQTWELVPRPATRIL